MIQSALFAIAYYKPSPLHLKCLLASMINHVSKEAPHKNVFSDNHENNDRRN